MGKTIVKNGLFWQKMGCFSKAIGKTFSSGGSFGRSHYPWADAEITAVASEAVDLIRTEGTVNMVEMQLWSCTIAEHYLGLT
jgi:hypothetical protein